MTTSDKYKVLIIDDVPANIKTLLSILSNDYQLFVATSGPNALEIINSKPIDLILLDIIMPGMDGFELCSILQSKEATREIPVIFITGISDPESEKQGLDLGAVDYVVKPFSPAVVRARVKNHLTLQASLKQLKSQNKALQEAEELRKQVEHITRHDLRTPLNSVIGFSDLLLNSEGIPAEHQESLQIIRQEGVRALHMINLSLGLLRMEQKTFVLTPQEVDLVPLLNNIKTNLKNFVRSKALTFQFRMDDRDLLDADKFVIWGEELLCFSVFSNLLKNAMEASPTGATISVTLHSGEATNTVAIHNHGAVPEQIRDKFFEKYVTIGKSTGTGLGTYSARLITEAQNGTIRLEPVTGDETTVTVSLPKNG